MIYSILGVKLFWNVQPFDPIITPNANFKSFGLATSMLVRCMMVLRCARARARPPHQSRALRVGALWGITVGASSAAGPAWDGLVGLGLSGTAAKWDWG